jgi:hypothetical protein
MSQKLQSVGMGKEARDGRTWGNTTRVNHDPSLRIVQRVTLLDLTPEQLDTYKKVENWVDNGTKERRGLPLEKLLLYAPEFQEFMNFMNYIKQEVKEPALGFDEKKFYNTSLEQYFIKNPKPVESTKATWAGPKTTKVPTKAESKEEKTTEKEDGPHKKEAEFSINDAAKKHFNHLEKGKKIEIPKNAEELKTYVSDNRQYFYKADDYWIMQLGDVNTKQKGGAYDLKPWSILIRNIKADMWEVFHYGPTGSELD